MKLRQDFLFMPDNGDSFPCYDGQNAAHLLYGFRPSMSATRKNIILSGDIFRKKTVYKYTDRRKAFDYIKNNCFTLRFVQPSEWWDPYEKRFYQADYSLFSENRVIKENHTKVLAMCVAAERDSEPSWEMYLDKRTKGERAVCLQYKIDFKALLTFLNYYIETKLNNEYMLVVGSVRYEEKSEINKMHKRDQNGEFECPYFKNFNFRNYINLLRLKRKAFKYESEIRLFLIPKSNDNVEKDLIIHVPNICSDETVPKTKRWRKIITQVSLDPKADENELNKYKNKFAACNLGLNAEDVVHSDLLADISPIQIGEWMQLKN